MAKDANRKEKISKHRESIKKAREKLDAEHRQQMLQDLENKTDSALLTLLEVQYDDYEARGQMDHGVVSRAVSILLARGISVTDPKDDV
jgi:transposase